jgi:hypothetical protein
MALRPFSLIVFGVSAAVAAVTPTVLAWFGTSDVRQAALIIGTLNLLCALYIVGVHEGIFLSKADYEARHRLENPDYDKKIS